MLEAFWALLGCALLLTGLLALCSLPRLGSRHERPDGAQKRRLRGPRAFPIVGSLHALADKGGPFEAFTRLARTYGDIYELRLGSTNCVVVSSYRLIKEVLIAKGAAFGGRPDFLRFHSLFGGDRNNSLALCDWSDLQRRRRAIARSFCSPRGGSCQQEKLLQVAEDEIQLFLGGLAERAGVLEGREPVKPLILNAVGNMFTRYMCSTRFDYSEARFARVCRLYDRIFWEINQGYAVDFLPWLKPLYAGHLRRLSGWAEEIREFLLEEIVVPHRERLGRESREPRDFTDALLLDLEREESELSWEHIMFELEDFLGGHSAIGNLVMLILAYVVLHPRAQRRIQAECDAVLARGGPGVVSSSDRLEMPYTEAAVWETLRVSSSPIVPHVATEPTSIDGHPIARDTLVFLNNFDLNTGEQHWGPDAREFRPERFIGPQNQVVRPEHFLPFSTGKRTCVGQRLVQGFAFVLVTGLLSRYTVAARDPHEIRRHLRSSCVAVPPDCFHLVFTPRTADS